MVEAAGPDAVFSDDEDRLRHALGKGYADLARVRIGELDTAPDAVVLPADAAHLGRILEACAAAGVAVVPFGGGSSVVGGIEALRGDHSAVISLDLAELRTVAVDERSLTATLGAGLRGPEAEAALNGRASRSATSRSPLSTRRSAASPPRDRPDRPRAATGASTTS